MRFIIKKSVLTEAFEERLTLDGVRTKDNTEVPPGGDGFHEIDKDDFDIEIFGPYHSTDMTIRSASNTHMVVLVGANGISVAESVLNFSKYRTNFWKKLIIIELCGSSAPTEQDLKKNNISAGRDPINLRSTDAADAADSDSLPSTGSCRSRSGKKRSSDAAGAPLLQPTPEGSLAIADSVWSSIVAKATADETPALSFQIYGALTSDMVGKLIDKLEGLHNAPNCVHYLICSRTWSDLINGADTPENKFSYDLWNRLHNEEFSV
jgi:hypothetical protein